MRAHPQDAITQSNLENTKFLMNVPPAALVLLPGNGKRDRGLKSVWHTNGYLEVRCRAERRGLKSKSERKRCNLLSLVRMMSDHVDDSARRVQGPVQGERDAGVAWKNGLGAG